MQLKLLHIIPALLLFCLSSFCQPANDTLKLTLQQVVEMAKGKSIAAKQAVTLKENKYWQWRTYKSNYQPQLSLNGILPGYINSFQEVVQPDGTIEFQPVKYNNSSLSLALSQSIAATGGTVFGTTQMQRYDDFDRKFKLYNGVPYAIGYSQPLAKFNQLRWDQKIEPLKYNESRQAFIESMEQIAIKATGYFFDLLLAQVNLQISATNFENTKNILRIAKEKFDIGKVSRNEILQLELEQLKAQKAVGIAKRDMEISTLHLRTYAGLANNDKIVLILPKETKSTDINPEKILSEALENRSDAIAFMRRIAEAKRDVAKAKGDNGINATLSARLGYSKSAVNLSKVYQAPKSQQLIQVEFDIPILDWGRSKSRMKTAEANKQFTEYAVEQDKQTFTQEIYTQITLYQMMKEQLILNAKADSIASEKYQIAKERYVLGNLSITDLSIAFQENDQAKRDFVLGLRDFWSAYYQLRYLSLYDLEKNQKIIYQ